MQSRESEREGGKLEWHGQSSHRRNIKKPDEASGCTDRGRERDGEGQRSDRKSRGKESKSGKGLRLNGNESCIRSWTDRILAWQVQRGRLFTGWLLAYRWIWTKCSAAKAEAGGFRFTLVTRGRAAQSQSRVPFTQWERKEEARPATRNTGREVLATEKKQRLLERKKRMSLMSW